MITVVVLVMTLLLPSGNARTVTKEYRTIEACKAGEDAAREAIQLSGDYVDVGTICVKSEFDPKQNKMKSPA